jgi:inositol transport system substrate-binding protein
MNVIEKNPDLFNEVIEVPTKWDAVTARANLEAALQRNSNVDFIFTASDFMYPQVARFWSRRASGRKSASPGMSFSAGSMVTCVRPGG